MKPELEARLLASARNLEQWDQLKEAFDPSDWKHYRPMFKYIDSVASKTGRLPRLVDLKETFDLPPTVSRQEGEFEHLFSEALSAKVATYVQEALDKAVTDYAAQPNELVAYLVTELSKWHRKHGGYTSSVTDSETVERLIKYERLAKENEERGLNRIGIKTGLSYFDVDEGIGWLPGELIGVVGRVYVGKSWLLIYFGLQAWMEGRSVLFISPEMTVDEVEVRWDALYYAMHGIAVNVSEMFRGMYPSKRMYELATEAKDSRWFTYTSYLDQGITLTSVAQLTKQHNPDLVIVDGLSLVGVTDQKSAQVWEQIKHLSYGFKNLAMVLNVPIIISHQATRGAHNTAKPPALHEIAYGDAFAQACDRVLTLSRPQYDPTQKTMRVTVQKFRKGKQETSGIDLLIDPERPFVGELEPDDDSNAFKLEEDDRLLP